MKLWKSLSHAENNWKLLIYSVGLILILILIQIMIINKRDILKSIGG